jgi:SAM-dependent methyltransferase
MGNDRVDYDHLWRDTWGDMQHVGPVHRHIQHDLVRVVRTLDVRSILDVGCGSGENLARLAGLNRFDLAGTDLSDEALSLARQRAPTVRFSVLDIERAALAESFDLVMSIQVVEHLEADIAALRNMAAMAKKYVFTSTMAGRMRPSERLIGHVRNYSAAELRRKLTDVGLDVLWVRGWGFPFYSPLYRSLVELLPAGPPSGRVGPTGRFLAEVLYRIYRFNVPGRGDVLSALARVRTG